MRKILNATQSTAKLTHEGETIAWSAIVQGAIFFHYSSKRGVKTARSLEKAYYHVQWKKTTDEKNKI